MEGTYQKGSKWYRCRFSSSRGHVAAELAGHPRALQIKEELILHQLLDFMGRRLFGSERLRLLRDDLARTLADGWREHDARLQRLEHELEDLDRALYRQTLRLEEHDDPDHPVVALAKRRITELSARREATVEAIAALETERPGGSRPAEIEAMLAAIPDLRRALKSASQEELADILDRFDIEAVYDKPGRTLELAATITPELVPEPERTDRPAGGRGIPAIFP